MYRMSFLTRTSSRWFLLNIYCDKCFIYISAVFFSCASLYFYSFKMHACNEGIIWHSFCLKGICAAERVEDSSYADVLRVRFKEGVLKRGKCEEWHFRDSSLDDDDDDDCFYIALFSTLEWLPFYSAFLNIHQSGVLTALAWLVPHETAAISVQVLCTPCNHVLCHFMQSHIHVWLAVTCHLHFWLNDQDLLCATAVTWWVEWIPK